MQVGRIQHWLIRSKNRKPLYLLQLSHFIAQAFLPVHLGRIDLFRCILSAFFETFTISSRANRTNWREPNPSIAHFTGIIAFYRGRCPPVLRVRIRQDQRIWLPIMLHNLASVAINSTCLRTFVSGERILPVQLGRFRYQSCNNPLFYKEYRVLSHSRPIRSGRVISIQERCISSWSVVDLMLLSGNYPFK